MSGRPSMRVSIPNPWGPPPLLAHPATAPLPALTLSLPLPRPPSPSLLPHALHATAVLFVLVEPVSPPAVELLSKAFVRFLALCPPWLSPLLSLGNHLRFCRHPQCSAIHCVQPKLPAARFCTERGLPARPSHNQQRRQQPRLRYHWYDFFLRGSFLSADSFA